MAGFDDDEKTEILQENIEIEVDKTGNPIMPEGWTFLIHGSSFDRWNKSLLGNDFVVGNAIINGKEVKRRPLCCVERTVAKNAKSIIEQKDREKYNPDNLFNKQKHDIVNETQIIANEVAIVEYKKNVFKKIINKILDIFKFRKMVKVQRIPKKQRGVG